MSDPYASPFEHYSGQRASGNAEYPDQHAGQRATQYADPYAEQYAQYPDQYPEQYPTQAQPAAQPSPQYPGEHYSSQAYVTPTTPTRRAVTRFPESGPIERDRESTSGRPAKKTGTPLGRIIMGVFLGMLLWTVVVGLIGVVLLASVAGRIENRLQDLDSSVHSTTSTSTSK